MRNRMVDKSAEACSSQMRLVFAERPNEFVGEVQHVDNKRIPVEYHKHNTPINDAYHVMKKFDHLPFYACVSELEYEQDLKSCAFMDWGCKSLRKYQFMREAFSAGWKLIT